MILFSPQTTCRRRAKQLCIECVLCVIRVILPRCVIWWKIKPNAQRAWQHRSHVPQTETKYIVCCYKNDTHSRMATCILTRSINKISKPKCDDCVHYVGMTDRHLRRGAVHLVAHKVVCAQRATDVDCWRSKLFNNTNKVLVYKNFVSLYLYATTTITK